MSHWQRKNVYKKIHVWVQLLAVSACVHIFFLCILFVFDRGHDGKMPVKIDRALLAQGVPVVVLAHNVPSKRMAESPKATALVLQSKVTTNVASAAKPLAPKQQPKVAAKQPVKTTTIAQAKPAVPKAVPQQEIKKADVPKSQPAVKPEVVAKKEVSLTPIAKKEIERPKKLAAQKEIAARPDTNSVENQSKVALSAAVENTSSHEDIPDGPIIVAKDYREKMVIKKHQLLQQELVRVWHPPVGMPDGCACSMRVCVQQDGRVRGVDVVQSSGIIMFDIAARSALSLAQMPKWTWGTSFDITFS